MYNYINMNYSHILYIDLCPATKSEYLYVSWLDAEDDRHVWTVSWFTSEGVEELYHNAFVSL